MPAKGVESRSPGQQGPESRAEEDAGALAEVSHADSAVHSERIDGSSIWKKLTEDPDFQKQPKALSEATCPFVELLPEILG